MPDFLKSLTIYPKLVLSFLLVIVPIYISSLMMNRSGQDIVQTQISDSMASRVHFYTVSLETELARLTRLKWEYLNDDDLLALANTPERLDDFERTQAILSIKNKLYLLKSSSPFVENVTLYIPALNRSINANNFDYQITDGELEAITDSERMRSALFGIQGRLLMSGAYPDSVYADRAPVLAMEIELSRAEIVRTLSSMSEGGQGGVAWIDASGRWQVSTNADSELLELLADGLGSYEGNEWPQRGQLQVVSGGVAYFTAHEYSPALGATLAVFTPAKTVMQPLSEHRNWIGIVSVIALLLVIVFSYWIHQLIHKPIKRLIGSFRKVEKGDLGVRVYHVNRDEFHYVYNQFNAMLGQIQSLIHEVYEQRIRSQQSELKQLQSQINPHFFYNSFFILQGLVQMREHELADKMFHHLGSYFQFITRSGAESVTLAAEMKHARAYVEIQKIRFSDTVLVELEDVPIAWESVMVPRLIVQPLIENAYQYGLENKQADGLLTLRFREVEENRLMIEVDDNGEELGDSRLEDMRKAIAAADRAMETTGILNVHRRLQLKFGEDCGLQVSRSELGGLQARLTIRREEGEE
ncbi:sensor histidine kinase [Paenibacillus agaridevorans]|uniref:sensor histidine kinase n=1 Tax=Paenibacillus agaridevorans TaxID=171404 RepID=UPI001BE43DFD|nr:histidine kinase [Paenibacillus agaridevorans]